MYSSKQKISVNINCRMTISMRNFFFIIFCKPDIFYQTTCPLEGNFLSFPEAYHYYYYLLLSEKMYKFLFCVYYK